MTSRDTLHLSPRKTAKQERSRRKAEHILDTTLELLAEGEGDRITTKMIAARAKISVGNLYQFYPNKEALYWDLFQRWMEQIIAALDGLEEELQAGGSPERFVDGILRVLGSNRAINSKGYWNLRGLMERSPELSAESWPFHHKLVARIAELHTMCSAQPGEAPQEELKLLQNQVVMACLYVLSETPEGQKQAQVLGWSRQIMLSAFSAGAADKI
ncbi:TetR/AcrR family transcriptional regulator [Leisingera sp. ANG-Vp]|uniref:TetR/AcrR family transcriptional regulator n=1 Tax=Leisingera sp. ANG-Vp TaxID=1577896 RepID=UPI00068EFE52|nr:TetR/AcrR family transcriptional regulator [Leisingera sp. ANG-Vp]